MKRYIQCKTTLKQGSYVVDRNGNIYDIGMHVPSTTYLSRGILHLSLTDADFLLSQGLITKDEATAIVLYCYKEFLEDELDIADPDEIISLTALTQFADYAETKWAPNARVILFKQNLRTIREIEEQLKKLPDFNQLNDKWYKYLKDNYCKVSRFGDVVEFRISSDGFDWNDVIIDKVILPYEKGSGNTRYNIVKESENGYQSYFMNATLNDILENDKAVLSSEFCDRKVVDRKVSYPKRFVPSSKKITASRIVDLEQWCKTLPKKIHTLYLHTTDGSIIGKMSVKDAVAYYGDARVTGSYSEGDGVISVWILK